MGFNDWNEIAAKYPPWSKGVNETDIRAVAQALVSTGLKDRGYVYVNLDCGYSNGTRGASGALIADKAKFPSGLKGLGAYIHSLGLKYGIYTSGSQCCAPKGSNDGLIGHEEADAAQMAAIGIDYVKNDDCGSTDASFLKFRDALNKTGRPMVYSIHTSWTHGGKKGLGPADAVPVANSWRTTNDIRNDWADILNRAMVNNAYAHLAGPGQWNDPDMLEVGNKGVTDAEGRSHFALWCLMKAPLLIGTDISKASAVTIATLGNEEAIAVNQDSLVRLPRQLYSLTALHPLPSLHRASKAHL
jgi:alpha-galactosidase